MSEVNSFGWGFIIGLLVMFMVFASICTPDKVWRRQAVEKGKAEYYLDKNFDRKWRWKE